MAQNEPPSSPASPSSEKFALNTNFFSKERIREMNLFLDKLIGLFLMVLGVGTGLAGMVLPETILGIQPPGSGLMGLASFILGSGVTFFGGVYLSSAQDKN